MADLAKKLTMDIADKSVKYMTSVAPDLAYDIKSTMDALEIELDRFPHFFKQSPLMFRFNRFAEAVTGDDFESATRPMRTRQDKDVLTVSRTRNELLTEIERQFKVHYC